MMKKFISFALHQPLVLIMLTILFTACGIAAFKTLPIEAFPDVSDVQVTVITLFPGHAPEEVEKQITIPLEIGLSGLPHSVRMFSHTQFGLSFLVVTFDDKVTDYFARQQVLERLQGVDLPPGITPQLAPLSPPTGEIYRYRLKSDSMSPTDLRTLQDWVVRRSLKLIPGVADIVSFGGFIKQYQVEINLAKMKSYKLSMQQVLTALGRSNANAGGSYLEQGERQYLIRGIGLLRSVDDIGNVVVAEHKGTPLLIKDIANVVKSYAPRQGIVGQDTDDEIVSGIVLLRKGENPSEVLDALKAKVDQLNAFVLPKNVRIVPYYDRTWLIHTTLHTVFKNLLEGAILVCLVLFIFLGHFTPAAIVAALIPLSLLATFIGLKIRGIPANLLSLGAMDFGIIVDGAVIVVENIFRKLSGHPPARDKNALREIVLNSTLEVGRPTLFSILIIIIAHIPIFTLQRHEGRIFAPMAYTVVSALIGSLIFSLTLMPLACFFLLGKKLPEKENRWLSMIKERYQKWLQTILESPRNRKRVIAGAVGALVLSLLCVPLLGSEFLPELNEGTLWVNVLFPPGISLSETTRLCREVRKIILGFPEVNAVISKAGRPEDGTDPKSLNMTEYFVDLKPESQWKRHIPKEKILAQMEKRIDDIPGVDVGISQPIRDNVLESISQIKGQIVIKIFGEDASILKEKAAEILQSISNVRGVEQAFIDRAGEVPQLQIKIDRKRAARYGLNVADVEDVIETALGGKVATEIWEGEKRFGVVVRLNEHDRRNIESIKKVLIDTPDGIRVPMGQIASIQVKNGRMNISREGGMHVAAVGVFIRGRDMGSIVKEMQGRIQKNVKMPSGYVVTWGGEFENQKRAMSRLWMIVPLSVFLIFVLLFDAFKSAMQALLILFNVPFALIGGIFALLLTGIPLSVSAAIGFIALFGQAVLNGVVMVSCFNQLKSEGKSVHDAIVKGAVIRLRTVMMTALLAMLGLLPMALSHGIGSEVQKPLAVVIIGGLISATFLTLIVLPVLYLLFEIRGAAILKLKNS